jgi:dipeptidyl aminopeptidase/acylaminoacyl peptidase
MMLILTFTTSLLLASGAQNPPPTPAQTPAQAPAAPPATEVFVASLAVEKGSVTVGKPENISKSAGYDNQPSFSPDGSSLYFASDRAAVATGSPTQTDIFRYDFGSRRLLQITMTPESEYSPTVTPDGQGITVIRVEEDKTQRLWRFRVDGGIPALVLEQVRPVGYHAWLTPTHLALFVLGNPATLQVADVKSGSAQVVAKGIGRSVAPIPGGGVSFVQVSGEEEKRTLTISELQLEEERPVTRPLTAAVAGAREADLAWTPDGTLLMAHAGTLYAWTRGESSWRAVADLGALGLKNVTRLAVSPKGDRIALVAGS